MPPICVMCGWVFEGTKGLRLRDTPELQALVRRQWSPGPFVYAGLMTLAEPVATCCAMCLKKRKGLAGNGTKSMMPMDEYLLSLMSPGRAIDHRRQKRMHRALVREVNGTRNPFLTIPWIREIASSSSTRVEAWWGRNLRTKFFRHKATARAVRMLVRETASV